jgi:peptidoglycan/LPS O-acetylase OafA/YrhL
MTHAALIFCFSAIFIVAQKVTGQPLAPMIDGQRFMDTGSVFFNNLFAVGVTLLAVGLAALAHKYIEMKGYELGKRVANPAASRPAAEPADTRLRTRATVSD